MNGSSILYLFLTNRLGSSIILCGGRMEITWYGNNLVKLSEKGLATLVTNPAAGLLKFTQGRRTTKPEVGGYERRNVVVAVRYAQADTGVGPTAPAQHLK